MLFDVMKFQILSHSDRNNAVQTFRAKLSSGDCLTSRLFQNNISALKIVHSCKYTYISIILSIKIERRNFIVNCFEHLFTRHRKYHFQYK